MIKEDFGGILYELRIQENLSQQELAARLCREGIDVTNQHIYKWEKNINRPNAIQFVGLCSVLGIRDVLGTFTSGKSTAFSRLNPEGRKKVNDYIRVLDASGLFLESKTSNNVIPMKALPVYTQPASAGTGMFLDSGDFDLVEVHNDLNRKADFGVKITGDSMMPEYIHGQIVWVHRQETLQNGDIGIFLLNGDAYIKKFVLHGNTVNLVSLNSNYSPIVINDSDTLLIYGKVIS